MGDRVQSCSDHDGFPLNSPLQRHRTHASNIYDLQTPHRPLLLLATGLDMGHSTVLPRALLQVLQNSDAEAGVYYMYSGWLASVSDRTVLGPILSVTLDMSRRFGRRTLGFDHDHRGRYRVPSSYFCLLSKSPSSNSLPRLHALDGWPKH
jgi:hypothetical protein